MTVEERYKKYMELGKDDIEKRKKTLDTQADEDIKTINTAADQAEKSVKDNYSTQISDTKESYNDAFRKNETQKVLNERYLERKSAEMGLTDSGMNRTQMTANQLSYGNTNAKIVADRQKAVNALTAAMQSAVANIDAKRSSDIADINRTLNANKANVDSSYSDWARQQAVDDYNEEAKNTVNNTVSPNNNSYVVNDYQKNPNKYQVYYDSQGNITHIVNKDEKQQKYKNILSAFENQAVPDLDSAANIISDYGKTYGMDKVEFWSLLQAAGILQEELDHWDKKGTIYMSPQEYNMAKRRGEKLGRVRAGDWDYKNNGSMRYYFTLTETTNNWGGGVDNDDRVTIYYPDEETVVAENVRIDQLPQNIRQDITDRTAGKKNGYKFYYSGDLAGSKF